MSNLLKVISDWKNGRPAEECDFRDLFKQHLHKPPYFLRYSLDKQRPNLVMIYMTDYSDREDALVQECNGIIIDSNDYSIVAYGMNRMLDRTRDYHSGKYVIPKGDEYVFEEAEDGAVLTVFHYDDSWVVSTKRNIDARNVRWSSQKNFYQLLEEAFFENNVQDVFERHLEPGYTYSFILLHPENHLVIPHAKTELLYISKRNNSTLEEENMATDFVDEKATMLDWVKRRRIMDWETCMKCLSERGKHAKRGIICYKRVERSIERVMIDYKWFSEANDLRKGMPSLHLSYLACNSEEKQKMRQFFGDQSVFNQIDDLLRNLVRYTYYMYRDSYVRKQFKIPLEDPIYKTIRKLHNEYKTTGQSIRIHHVVNVIDTIPPHILDSILSYFAAYGFYRPDTLAKSVNDSERFEFVQPSIAKRENTSQPSQSQRIPSVPEMERSSIPPPSEARIDDEEQIIEYEEM